MPVIPQANMKHITIVMILHLCECAVVYEMIKRAKCVTESAVRNTQSINIRMFILLILLSFQGQYDFTIHIAIAITILMITLNMNVAISHFVPLDMKAPINVRNQTEQIIVRKTPNVNKTPISYLLSLQSQYRN